MNAQNPETGPAASGLPSRQAAWSEAVVLLARAARLTAVFRRLFWVAAAGLGLTGMVVVYGDWEAHPGWWVGWAVVGQTWMAAAAWWALRVYGRAEELEQEAARAAPALADSLDGHR